MPITAHYNEMLRLRVHCYSGFVQPTDIQQLAAFYAENRQLVLTDVISIIDEDVTDTSALVLPTLPAFRKQFRELHIAANFLLLRRSAWVCPSRAAWPVLEQWLDGRHSHDGQGSEVCLVATLAEIDILFDEDEIEAVQSWHGFRQLC